MSRIKTVSRAHTVSEKVAMTTKNDGLEVRTIGAKLEVTIAFLAEPRLPDRDDRRSLYSATSKGTASGQSKTAGKAP